MKKFFILVIYTYSSKIGNIGNFECLCLNINLCVSANFSKFIKSRYEENNDNTQKYGKSSLGGIVPFLVPGYVSKSDKV